MAGQPLNDLVTEVGEATTVMKSAAALIRGFKTRMDAAVAEALANGASAEELEPLTALSAELDATGNDLAAAVEENT